MCLSSVTGKVAAALREEYDDRIVESVVLQRLAVREGNYVLTIISRIRPKARLGSGLRLSAKWFR